MSWRKRQIIGILFFFLFAAYWCGIHCFTHSHVVNGAVIVHSHPYEDEDHTHTEAQYETIFYLTHFFSIECTHFHFENLVRYALVLTPFFVWHCPAVLRCLQRCFSLRAPPQKMTV